LSELKVLGHFGGGVLRLVMAALAPQTNPQMTVQVP
jgi:hypothetical protein